MVHRRLLTVLAIGAVMAGASAIGGAAGPAQKPLTSQEIAKTILSKGTQLTGQVRAGLEMIARGDRQLGSNGSTDGSLTAAANKANQSQGGNQEAGGGLQNVLVNNPGEDSHQTDQTTQSETTVAVHGKNVVVGFNDSQVALGFALTAGLDLTGYAYSSNGGKTFTDGGGLPNRPGEQNLGDPWLGSDRNGNFYFSNILINVDPFTGFSYDIGVAKSTDGGRTFSAPVKADTQPEAAMNYTSDKPALATGRDPSMASRDNTYVVWDDFVFDFTTFTQTNGLPVARSFDGGASYQVTYADRLAQGGKTGCSFSQFFGSSILVDPRDGTLYVAATKLAIDDPGCNFPPPTFSHVVYKSTDGGQTFGPGTVISDVTPPTPTALLKLGPHQYMRLAEFPNLSMDPAGNLYDSWNDGATGKSHIRLAKSSDGGATWGCPTAQPSSCWVTTGANDEVQPAISADASGVHDLYYKRNADNTLDVIVANSTNGGASWAFKRVTSQSFPGVYTFPQFDGAGLAPAYMGDYIANTSNGTNQYFAWGDNRNIVTNFMWPQGRHDPDVFFAQQGRDNNDGGGGN
jgi:hypothetical protein